MSDKHFFHTPVGRFVSGDLTKLRDKDINDRPIEPHKQRYEFGLAIRKDDPGLPAMIQGLAAYAKAGYASQPVIQQRIDAWFQTMSGFSMKISDGDKPAVSTGRVNENTTGCFVLWFSTAMPILTANAQNIQIDPETVKRGYFIDVAASAAVNNLVDHNAGIYLNPTCVRLIAEGDVIAGGMNVDTALQNAPAAPTQLPPGARPVGSTPQAPASSGAPGTGMPGMPGAPAQQPAQQPAQGGAVMPGTGMPGMPGAPAQGGAVMPGTGMPGMPGAPAQQPAQGGAVMPGTGMPGMPQANPTPAAAMPPATPQPGAPMPGVQGGMPQTGAAPAPGGQTASPGETPQTGYPPHPGVMMPGMPQS